ncbi:MAG: hypothetical protein IKU86_09040 [Thermoguttaceae bacterium]|nr:hypothetical protein [Thermoguttaceae bacterium]
MIYVKHNSREPYFNLAVEEFFLTRSVDDATALGESPAEPILLLWQNEPTVVVGGRQNTLEEINLEFIERRGVRVVRRITGGGAVYHDLGNLNYSFIVPDASRLGAAKQETASRLDLRSTETPSLAAPSTLAESFRRLAQPIVDVLRAWNIPAELSGRNDITVCERKVSGSAQARKNGRTLHHGTLLFDSNLDDVASALRVDAEKFRSKAVSSIRARVANLVEFLPPAERANVVERFQTYLLTRLSETQPIVVRELNNGELVKIRRLRDEKYATWDWNFGSSPRFQFRASRRFDWGKFELAFDVVRGRIERAQIFGDFFALDELEPLLERFVGAAFERGALSERISEPLLRQALPFMSPTDFVELALSAAPTDATR